MHENLVVDDPPILAQLFNSYFSSIGSRIVGAVAQPSVDFRTYLSGDYMNSFYLNPVTADLVSRTISGMKSKSCQLDEIPMSVLKSLNFLLSPVLSFIINLSFNTGIFPDRFKTARVVPISKGGDSTDVSNYRPISLLSNYSKIFERIVHSQLIGYFESKDIFFSHQYGFRSNKSTLQAILHMLQEIYNTLDDGNLYFSMFLDLKKAFDCVSHEVLLTKLYHYGIRGTPHDWLRSYLTDRKQFVSLDDCNSNLSNISCGVPQGSILGPLLFLIFVNDLPNCDGFFDYTLFADDTSISCKFPRDSLNNVHLDINTHLSSVTNWLAANRLQLNVNKTKYMVFSYSNNFNLQPINICGGVVDCVRSLRYLGLVLDNNLNFSKHIESLSLGISRNVGVLSRVSHFLPPKVLKCVYFSIVHPHFVYCIEAWYGTSKYLTNRLFSLQKRAVRLLVGADYFDHTDPIFRQLKLLKLDDLYIFSLACYVYKSINIPNYDALLQEYINQHTNQHIHFTRNAPLITLPLYTRSKSQFSLFYSGCKVWNEVDPSVTSSSSLASFKFGFKIGIFEL